MRDCWRWRRVSVAPARGVEERTRTPSMSKAKAKSGISFGVGAWVWKPRWRRHVRQAVLAAAADARERWTKGWRRREEAARPANGLRVAAMSLPRSRSIGLDGRPCFTPSASAEVAAACGAGNGAGGACRGVSVRACEHRRLQFNLAAAPPRHSSRRTCSCIGICGVRRRCRPVWLWRKMFLFCLACLTLFPSALSTQEVVCEACGLDDQDASAVEAPSEASEQ